MHQHFEERYVLEHRVAKFCEKLSQKWKLWFSLLCDAYNKIKTLIPTAPCLQHISVRKNYFARENQESVIWKKECFWWHQFQVLTVVLWRNQEHQNFVLVSYYSSEAHITYASVVHSKHKLHKLALIIFYLTWCNDGYRRVSG